MLIRNNRTSAPSYAVGPATTLGIATTLGLRRRRGRGMRGMGDAAADAWIAEVNADDGYYANPATGEVFSWDDSVGDYVPDAYMTQALADFQTVAGPTAAAAVVRQATANNAAAGGGSTGFISELVRLIPTVVQAQAQSQLIRTNLTRAQQGLPPIPMTSVTPGFNFGLTADTQSTLIKFGVMALVAYGAVSMFKHR